MGNANRFGALLDGALLEGGGRQQGRGVVSRSKEAQSRDCLAGASSPPIGAVVEKTLGIDEFEWTACSLGRTPALPSDFIK